MTPPDGVIASFSEICPQFTSITVFICCIILLFGSLFLSLSVNPSKRYIVRKVPSFQTIHFYAMIFGMANGVVLTCSVCLINMEERKEEREGGTP